MDLSTDAPIHRFIDSPRKFGGKQCVIIVSVVSLILVASFSVSFYFILRNDLEGKIKCKHYNNLLLLNLTKLLCH